MIATNIKIAAAAILSTGLVVGSASVMAYQQASGSGQGTNSQGAVAKNAATAVDANKTATDPQQRIGKAVSHPRITEKNIEKIDSIVSERIAEITKSVNDKMKNNFDAKVWNFNTFYSISMRLVEAESKASVDHDNVVQSFEHHLDRMMSMFDYCYAKNFENNLESINDLMESLSHVRNAEQMLANAKEVKSTPIDHADPKATAMKRQESADSGAAIDAKKNEKPANPHIPSMRAERKKPINKAIFAALDRAIPMHFPNDTPFEEVLEYVRKGSAQEPGGKPIAIYVDPNGLEAADKTMSSCVAIDLEAVPLRVTLDFVLNQLGLCYFVKSGVLFVSSENAEDLTRINNPDGPYADPEE